jgi:hypothetical protein
MKKIFIVLLLGCLGLNSIAQKSEIGGMVGTSFYLGDLNPTSLFPSIQPCGGIIYRYNFNPRWALKANIIFAEVKASDSENNNQYARNLSFKSPITEISSQVELNFFNLFNIPARNHFSPYIYLGLSVFSFNPQAELNGRYYDLQSLGTEGQGIEGQNDPYSLVSMAIPFGFGVKWNIGKYISLGAEWGMRYTFTDYLDDVSTVYFDQDILLTQKGEVVAQLADRSVIKNLPGTQRGNEHIKDWYSFAVFTATFKIGNQDTSCNIKYNVKPKKNNSGRKY